jgi:hypothetical protein
VQEVSDARQQPRGARTITIVAAVAGEQVALLTVRSWPRDDVEAAMERIVGAIEILACDAGAAGPERV